MLSIYLDEALDPTRAKRIVEEIVELLTPKLELFDAIAFSGSSGLLIGPAVAMALDKSMILVRKESPQDGTHHSDYQVEGDDTAERYIIIDDLVSSGSTLERIQRTIADEFSDARYMGTILYRRVVRIYEWV